jgi:uncharacterized membrane protein (Fun14 family)
MVTSQSFIITLGGSFLIGGMVGVIARNYFKVLAFVLGAEIAFITYLQHLDLINIQWNNIQSIVDNVSQFLQTLQVPEDAPDGSLGQSLAVVGGFVVGFTVGFKFG